MNLKRTLQLFIIILIVGCKKNKNPDINNDKPIFKIVEDSFSTLPGLKHKVGFNKGDNNLFVITPKNYTIDIVENKNSSAIYNSSKKEYSKLKRNLNLTDDFTISIWINPGENKGDMHPIINRSLNDEFKKPYYQFLLALRGEDYKESPYTFFCWLSIDNKLISLSSLMNWQPKNWYNLTVTYDQEKVKFYVNGKLQGQKIITGKINSSSEEIFIAKHCKFDYYYNGSIDNLQIYDRSLSVEEVIILSE
jgi:hypothetical protein